MQNIDKKLDDFLENENSTSEEKNNVIINDKKDGLIERVNKTFVTEDGKQLLRERLRDNIL